MLSSTKGKRIMKYLPDYVVFDLETTGISTAYDEVVEISAVKVKGGRIVEEFGTLVNPGRPIPLAASRVNGITDSMVRDAPGFQDALGDFLEFAGDDVLVGHNIHTFDMKFIYRDAERFFGQLPGNDYVDTLQMARRCLPQLSAYKLVDLAVFYGISPDGAHRALNDCRMNQQIFERLGQELQKLQRVQKPKDSDTDVKICPQCGEVMKRRNGRFGEFWGCGGFPGCRYTENIRGQRQ